MNPSKIVFVVRAVIKFGDRYLLVEQMNASGNNYLLFPGGHVESGESLLVALRREVREELNIRELRVKSLRFVKETLSPFDRNLEFFFDCDISMRFDEIEVAQKEFVGQEKIKSCVLKHKDEIRSSLRFYPKDFFSPSRYALLELDLDQYKILFGRDNNIESLENEG